MNAAGTVPAAARYLTMWYDCTRESWYNSYPVLRRSVPEFLDLGERRHPVVNNFPLSHVIFKVNFPLSNDPLALVSAKRQQQRHNTGLSLKSARLSSFIELISHIFYEFSLFMAF